MATNKLANSIRKVVDKTPIVDVTIIDKQNIPMSRGIGLEAREGTNREEKEGTYPMAGIIDGTNSPALRDDPLSLDLYEKVAKITGMTDEDDESLTMILKPNGIFD